MKYKYNSILKYAENKNYSMENLYFSLLARESINENGKINFINIKNQKYIVDEIIDKSIEKIGDNELGDAITFLLERYSNQKGTGTYYTPGDVTEFMSKFLAKKYLPGNTIMDPTSGTGSLLIKLINIIEINPENVYAMDIDPFAIEILRQRLYVRYLNKYDEIDLRNIINENIYVNDILSGIDQKADIIISNPPYFELSKKISKYGNIYADSYDAICNSINDGGSLSIIIPISFQSTIRMQKIRELVQETFSEIDIYSFGDRPDSLFKGVHQKLNIVNCSIGERRRIRTSNYIMWRSGKRDSLFQSIKLFKNKDIQIKTGTRELNDFYKVMTSPIENINSYLDPNGTDIYISSRLAQWSKAVMEKQEKGEYTVYRVMDKYAKQLTAIFNTNSYYVYWTMISDGWHNTKKYIESFKIEEKILMDESFKTKCSQLLKSLEETKEFIGSKQTDFIYRHRLSKKYIDKVDKYMLKEMDLKWEEIIEFQKGDKDE